MRMVLPSNRSNNFCRFFSLIMTGSPPFKYMRMFVRITRTGMSG